MSYVLSIDPSLSSTGYSVIDLNTKEVVLFSRYVTKNNISENQRIINIVWKLQLVLEELKEYSDLEITEIAMEDGYIGASVKTGLTLCKLRGGIITYFGIMGLTVYTQLPSETRKNLGLKGNAKKEEVAEFITNTYPELAEAIGPYSDKTNKQKTSDIYDSVCIGFAHINKTRG